VTWITTITSIGLLEALIVGAMYETIKEFDLSGSSMTFSVVKCFTSVP